MKSLITFFCLISTVLCAEIAEQESAPVPKMSSKRDSTEQYGYITFGGLPVGTDGLPYLFNVGIGVRTNYLEKNRAIDHSLSCYLLPVIDRHNYLILSYQFTPIKYFGHSWYGGMGLEFITPVNIRESPYFTQVIPNIKWVLGKKYSDYGIKFSQLGINTLPLALMLIELSEGHNVDYLKDGGLTVVQFNIGF